MTDLPRRTTPRYLRFLLTGAAVGLVLTVLVVLSRGSEVARPAVLFFYLGIVLTGLGALLGGVVAVAMESRRRR